MHTFLGILGIALIAVILWDVFEVIILPRRVTRSFRLARFFYKITWLPWRWFNLRLKPGTRRESLLSFYAPLSLLMLFAVWAAALIFCFAMIHYSIGSAINVPGPDGSPVAQGAQGSFRADLYMSGTTFFTLGLGDVTPRTPLARVVTVFEAGLGFGFLALAVSYLPVLYGSFSRREVNISLLDARAGSPPTAGELLKRHTQPQSVDALAEYLKDWEKWSAELMESHLSYPVLCYFRSQHNNESWLAAMTTILDTSALLLAYGSGKLKWQAKLTFAISRHAIVDLSQVLKCPPRAPEVDRLPAAELLKLKKLLDAAGIGQCAPENDEKLRMLRKMYEPYITTMSERLLMYVPAWTTDKKHDNWQTSAWARISTDAEVSPLSEKEEREHF